MVRIFSSNKTDTSLNGMECKPDIRAHFGDISVARSHGPRYRHTEIEEKHEHAHTEAPKEPGKIHLPKTMPSGDVVVAAQGIGGENFNTEASSKFIMNTLSRLGHEIGKSKGAATMAMLVKSSESIDIAHLGDAVITIIGKDKDGKRKIMQLTLDEVGTHIVKKPKKGAEPDAEGNYKDEDMEDKISASPYNYIGQYEYQPHENSVTSYSYDEIEDIFGKDAVIIVSTDGLYDSALHEEPKYFPDGLEQSRYVQDLMQKTAEAHAEFIEKIVSDLERKGYTPEHPRFAELLTRYVRTKEMHQEEGHPNISYDDCGIICIKASRPKDASEQIAALAVDAIGDTKLEGVKTSRQIGDIFEEEALKTVPHATVEIIDAKEFEHVQPVHKFSDAQLKYLNEEVNGTVQPRIVMEFNEPADFAPMNRTYYETVLQDIRDNFGVDVRRIEATESKPAKVRILIAPENADKVERLSRAVGGKIFSLLHMSQEWQHDGSLNELASSQFLEHHIAPDKTKLLQELLQRSHGNFAER